MFCLLMNVFVLVDLPACARTAMKYMHDQILREFGESTHTLFRKVCIQL